MADEPKSRLDRQQIIDSVRSHAVPEFGEDGKLKTLAAFGDTSVSPGESPINDHWLAQLAELTSIEELSLTSRRHFTDDGLKHLSAMRNIRDLNLYDTRVGDAGLAHLQDLTNLRSVVLGETKVKNGLEHLKKAAKLEGLWLNRSHVTDESLRSMRHFPALQTLNLEATNISDDGIAHLQNLKHLEILWLADTELTDQSCKHFANLTSLTVLDLNDTKVGNAGIKQLRALAHLRELRLRNTQVTDVAIQDLKVLKKLKDLNLYGTQISPNGYKELSKALPDCDIFWESTR